MYHVREDAPQRLFSEKDAAQKNLDEIEFRVIKRQGDLLVFEMLHADASIANALRRIMLAEVETVAVDRIGIMNNTSIIQDEVLAHRIGLIPFDIDPEKLQGDEELNFDLDVTCTSEEDSHLLSSKFQWVPNEGQEERFADRPPRPIHDDIVIAKLLPGQHIFLRAQCKRGTGQDHAKWSPVATAAYRIMPKIELIEPQIERIGPQLVELCPKNVFDIEDTGDVVVARPLDCTMCRGCLRPQGWEEAVSLKRVADHFIFSIESVGMIPPEDIFRRALLVLKKKADKIVEELEKHKK
mmetsp:Transcript_22481/g.35863  ORF Transcript_22481/g.35863 Transcript_22481/m.35863 type:complete len:296 (-) Transcript_22481:3276-4163(-)